MKQLLKETEAMDIDFLFSKYQEFCELYRECGLFVECHFFKFPERPYMEIYSKLDHDIAKLFEAVWNTFHNHWRITIGFRKTFETVPFSFCTVIYFLEDRPTLHEQRILDERKTRHDEFLAQCKANKQENEPGQDS